MSSGESFLALAWAGYDPDVVWLQVFLLASLADELIKRLFEWREPQIAQDSEVANDRQNRAPAIM